MSNYRKRPLGQARLQTFEEFYDKLAYDGLIPPQLIDAERSLLGSMMIDRTSVGKIIQIIGDRTMEESPFYREQHTWIYQAIVKLDRISETVDLLSVTNKVREMGKLDLIGGIAYLMELTAEVVTTANVESHARIILSKHLMREAIRAAEEIKLRAFIGEETPDELVTEAERAFARLSEARYNNKGFRHSADISTDAAKQLEATQNRKSGVSGAPSGLEDLDNLTCGWQKKDLIVLGARPSQGKTAISLTFAKNLALHPDLSIRRTVAYVSLEMSGVSLILRLISSMTGIDMQVMRRGQLTADDWKRFGSALSTLRQADTLMIDDTKAMNVDELRSKLRSLSSKLRAESRAELGLVVIDYFSLLTISGYFESERIKYKTISTLLKNLADELDVPIMVLSQLGRDVDDRRNNRPMPSDLRETGQLEQDADVILFIFRPWTYGILTYEKTGESTEYIAELILAKQRNGPIDDIKVHFNKHTQQFSNKEQAIFENAQQEAF